MTSPAEESPLKVKESKRAHSVFTEFGERNDCVVLYLMGARQCRVKVSPVDTGAQHNTDRAEWDCLWLLGDWIKPSSFATYHILLHGFRQFLIFHPWSWQWAFYILPISSTVQLALSSSMSWWCFFPFRNFSPFSSQAENQIYKSKAMGERHGNWRAFKSFQSSQGFRERNKQEIKMELKNGSNPSFQGIETRCIS